MVIIIIYIPLELGIMMKTKNQFTLLQKIWGDKLTGVPYTIIGNKSFCGFDEKYKNDFIIAIENQYNSNFDVYFDKIKK